MLTVQRNFAPQADSAFKCRTIHHYYHIAKNCTISIFSKPVSIHLIIISIQASEVSLWKRVGSAVFYGFTSILVVFVNKILLTNFKYVWQKVKILEKTCRLTKRISCRRGEEHDFSLQTRLFLLEFLECLLQNCNVLQRGISPILPISLHTSELCRNIPFRFWRRLVNWCFFQIPIVPVRGVRSDGSDGAHPVRGSSAWSHLVSLARRLHSSQDQSTPPALLSKPRLWSGRHPNDQVQFNKLVGGIRAWTRNSISFRETERRHALFLSISQTRTISLTRVTAGVKIYVWVSNSLLLYFTHFQHNQCPVKKVNVSVEHKTDSIK